MKKYMQNILAQHSNNEIAYLCGKCGREVAKEAAICPFCNAKLGNIRCPFCDYQGTIHDFSDDTCPRCGRKRNGHKKNIKKTRRSDNKSTLSNKLFWTLFLGLMIVFIFVVTVFLYYFEIIKF